MTDRELLEKAAKAIGFTLQWSSEEGLWPRLVNGYGEPDDIWNPLAEDGDALRLAVKLCLVVDVEYHDKAGKPTTHCQCFRNDGWIIADETHGADACAATRRAIVRAAAAMGDA